MSLVVTLKNEKQFSAVNKEGKKYFFDSFIAIINNNSSSLQAVSLSDKKARVFLGVKASRKIGKAILRNKIKRRIRHIVREVAKNLNNNNDQKLGIIIVPRKTFATVCFSKLLSQILNISHVKDGVFASQAFTVL